MEIKVYQFLVTLVFWYDVLYKINVVSKFLQNEDCDLTTAVEMLEKTMKFLDEYHESGFEQAVIAANELAKVMNCEPCFKMKRIRKTKKLEIYEGSDEPFNDAKEEF
jgi:hypothetical protein